MFFGITIMIFQAMNPIIASLLVPGLGEAIQGQRVKARAFFTVEGSIWLSYFGFSYFSSKTDHSARAFAVEHAGANPNQTDDDYYNALEDYLCSDDYNLVVERDASWYYPDDPEKQSEYIKKNGYFAEDAWKWDAVTNKTHYWERRKSARTWKRRAQFMPGFAVINRIVSVIDVVVFSNQENFGLDTRPGRIGFYYKF